MYVCVCMCVYVNLCLRVLQQFESITIFTKERAILILHLLRNVSRGSFLFSSSSLSLSLSLSFYFKAITEEFFFLSSFSFQSMASRERQDSIQVIYHGILFTSTSRKKDTQKH